MKKFLSLMAVATVLVFTACSEDNDIPTEKLKGKNKVVLDFDNGIAGVAIKIGKTPYKNASNETITISALDYIVGNFVLTNDDGKEVKVEGFYIISEGGKTKKGEKIANSKVELLNIPAGKYTKIKFGIGVDKATFDAQTEKFNSNGKKSEGIDLWTAAKKYGLVWKWTAGYKFTQFEGTYTLEDQKKDTPFKVHIAGKGDTDLYKEVELSMETALVSSDISPQLHIKVDADKILSGETKIKLSEGSDIMGGDKAKSIAKNITKMFTVHHVHNNNHHK